MSTLPKNGIFTPALNSASVATRTSSTQPQHSTAPDDVKAGNARVLADVQVTRDNSQFIAASQTQIATPAPTGGTSASAEVPEGYQAHLAVPPIVLLPADQALSFISTQPSIADMTLDQKFETLKQGLSMVGGIRKILVEAFESIVADFKTYAKNRKGMPTVEEGKRERPQKRTGRHGLLADLLLRHIARS